MLDQSAVASVSVAVHKRKVGRAERRNGLRVLARLWHEARKFSHCEFCTGTFRAQIAAEPDVDIEMKCGDVL